MASHFLMNRSRLGGLVFFAGLLCVIIFVIYREFIPLGVQSNETQKAAVVASKADPFEDFQKIQLLQVIAAIDGGHARVIDARPPLFFQMGHLPGAINLPKKSLQSAYVQSSELARDKQRMVIVYCESANCQDSTLVASDLKSLGHMNVSIYSGGWQEWQAAGQQVETGH